MLVVIEKLNARNLNWLKRNYRKGWDIFCLDKADRGLLDFADDFRDCDLDSHFLELTDLALEQIDADTDRIDALAKKLSAIVRIDVSLALQRYLLNTYYLRRARVAKIKSLLDLPEADWLYVDRDTATRSEGFLNISAMQGPLAGLRPLGNFCYWAIHDFKHAFKPRVKPVDLLLKITPGTAVRLRGMLESLGDSDLRVTAVDRSNGRVLYGPDQKASFAHDRFHKYVFHALSDYVRFLCSSMRSNVLLARFVSLALFEKYHTQSLYSRFRCRMIVVDDEYDLFQSIAYRMLKQRDVYVLNVMHGEKLYELRDMLAEHDNCLVWGEYYRKLFEKLRYQGKEITVVGNPAYDCISNYEVSNQELLKIRKSYRKIISVYTQVATGCGSLECQSRMLDDTCNYVRDKPDVYVFVKRHPYEYKRPTLDYDAIIGGLPNVGMYGRDLPLYDLVSISDVIITPYSTVGLEGILFRKNVLYVNYGHIDNLLPYPDEGGAMEIRESDECSAALDALLDGAVRLNHQNTIDLHANGANGQAARSIRDEIVKRLRPTGPADVLPQ